jgi:hypothetical protein
MFFDKIPKVFFNYWFWIAIIAVIIAIHYIWGNPPPPPKKSAFYEKHKQAIMRIMDIFVIALILSGWLLFTYQSISSNVKLMLKGTFIPTKELIIDSVASFSIVAIFWSGMSGVLIGFMSVFQSNLTKRKRLILLVISILPIGFTILASCINKPLTLWSIGLIYLTYCLIINGPAIIAGKHITQVGWLLMRKLKLISGEYPG